jgi:hypothetical protein
MNAFAALGHVEQLIGLMFLVGVSLYARSR